MKEPFFQFELSLAHRWKMAEQLRTGVVSCLSSLYPNPDFCDTLGMVVAELLENALKYGHGVPEAIGPASLRLKVIGNEDSVLVEVSNPVDPRDPNLQKLFNLLDHLSRATSAQDAYVDLMREVAASGAAGGLGLARIAYEANCSLRAELGANGLLHVRALTRPDQVENLWATQLLA